MSTVTLKKAKRVRNWTSLVLFLGLAAVIFPLEAAKTQFSFLPLVWIVFVLWLAGWTFYIFLLQKRAGSPHPLKDALTT